MGVVELVVDLFLGDLHFDHLLVLWVHGVVEDGLSSLLLLLLLLLFGQSISADEGHQGLGVIVEDCFGQLRVFV